MQRLKEKLLPLLPLYLLLSFTFFWLWLNRDIYFDPSVTLPRDNIKHHLPMMMYVGEHLRIFHTFPEWLYSIFGGVWLSALSNNFLVLMPHRILGAVLTSFGTLHPNLVYKICLLLGQFVFCFGLYQLSKEFFKALWVRVLVLLVAFTTGITLTFTYQEHALGTSFYLPWIWLCFLKLEKSSRYLIPLAALLGLSFNNHYPQLIFIYVLILGVAFLTSFEELKDPILKRIIKVKNASWKIWGLSAVSFILSASPVLYSYASYHDKLESPFRNQKDGISTVNFQEYEYINSGQTKLFPPNLSLYFGFKTPERVMQGALDESMTYMGPFIAFVLFGLLFFKVRARNFHLFLVLALAALSCGTYTFAPRIFWNIVPGITLFRQWIFFQLFLNLHLLYLTFVIGKAYYDWKIQNQKDWIVLGAGIAFFTVALALKWVEPLHSIPAIGLFALKTIRKEAFAKYFTIGFYSWVLLGSIDGGVFFLNYLRVYTNEWRSSHLFQSYPAINGIESYANLKNIYQQFVALPKGISSNDYLGLNSRADFYYGRTNGELVPVPKNSVSLLGEGFQIKNDPNFRFLVLPQLNDQEWYVKTDGFLPIKTGPTESVGTWVKIPSGAKEIQLRRRHSLWSFLILFMWFPLVGYGLYGAYEYLQPLVLHRTRRISFPPWVKWWVSAFAS